MREEEEKKVLKSLARGGITNRSSAMVYKSLRRKYPELARTLPEYNRGRFYN